MSMGIRYLVIAAGSPDLPATEEDVRALQNMIEKRIAPFTVTPLTERVSNRLTWALIEEQKDTVDVD